MARLFCRIALLSAVALVLLLGGCALGGKSIEDRVDDFVSDVLANRWSSLYTHLHPDVSVRSAAAGGFLYWDTTPFSSDYDTRSFSISGYGSNTTGTYSSTLGSNQPITFEMDEDDPDDWYIRRITIPGLVFTLE